MFRHLLENVRVDGYINIGESLFMRDLPPFIYNGESTPSCPGSVHYYNSGGRSVVFERDGGSYRIKGTDPFGLLTERVANSGNNRIEDVQLAWKRVQRQKASGSGQGLVFDDKKPFGVLSYKQAECAKAAFQRMAEIYESFGIENPCEFISIKKTDINRMSESTYQLAFRLPAIESDLRVKEFDSVLAERLDSCSQAEIASKTKNINRLYGRFIYWAGFNAFSLASAGLLPVSNSFRPQNWVISRHKDGYGIFRVDHTSTKVVEPKDALKGMTEEKDMLPHIIHEFSIFPSRVQVAADPVSFLSKRKKAAKFSEILKMKGVMADETKILDAHRNVFGFGVAAGLGGHNPDPIPKSMFQDALA